MWGSAGPNNKRLLKALDGHTGASTNAAGPAIKFDGIDEALGEAKAAFNELIKAKINRLTAWNDVQHEAKAAAHEDEAFARYERATVQLGFAIVASGVTDVDLDVHYADLDAETVLVLGDGLAKSETSFLSKTGKC